MTIRAIGGVLEGEYRCARTQKGLRINGCLAGGAVRTRGAGGRKARAVDAHPAGKGQLTEFGIDDAPTAQLYFDWTIADGVLTFTGYRCGTGHLETDDFKVVGQVGSVEWTHPAGFENATIGGGRE